MQATVIATFSSSYLRWIGLHLFPLIHNPNSPEPSGDLHFSLLSVKEDSDIGICHLHVPLWMKWESISHELSVWNTRVKTQKITLKQWQIFRRICCQIEIYMKKVNFYIQFKFTSEQWRTLDVIMFVHSSNYLGTFLVAVIKNWKGIGLISWTSINGETLEEWLNSSWGVQWSFHLLCNYWPIKWKGCNSSPFRHR